nr:hypothetical protein B0A51_03359 [Rachicladosporium sp. CCFEE 5018]
MYERLCPPPRSTPALNYSFTDAGEASRRESGCIDATGDILIGCSRTLLEAGRIPTPALAIHDVEPLAALDHEQPDINTCLRETEPWADLDDDFPAAHSLSDQWSPTISNDSPCDSLSSDVDDRTDSDKADTRSPSAGHETRSTSSRDQPAYRLASVGSVDASVRPRVPGAIMMALRVSHLLHIYYEVAFDALDGLSSRSYDSQTVQDVRGMQADLDLVLERLQETYQGYGDALIELRLEQDKVRDFMIKARELMGESSHEAHLGLSTQ